MTANQYKNDHETFTNLNYNKQSVFSQSQDFSTYFMSSLICYLGMIKRAKYKSTIPDFQRIEILLPRTVNSASMASLDVVINIQVGK